MAYRLMFMAVLFREGHIVLLSLESTCCKASLFTFTCTELLRSRTIFDVQGSKDANAQSPEDASSQFKSEGNSRIWRTSSATSKKLSEELEKNVQGKNPP
jgi:hypothetical protein